MNHASVAINTTCICILYCFELSVVVAFFLFFFVVVQPKFKNLMKKASAHCKRKPRRKEETFTTEINLHSQFSSPLFMCNLRTSEAKKKKKKNNPYT